MPQERNDLRTLRKLARQQRREIELLLRALDNERLLAARQEDRARWMMYARSEN